MNRSKSHSPEKGDDDAVMTPADVNKVAKRGNRTVKKAGIYQMLMQITHGIKIKPPKKAKVPVKSGKSESTSKAPSAKNQAKNSEKNVKKVNVDP